MTTTTTTSTTNVTDLYPSRGAAEVSVPRQDPVVWGAPGTPGPFSVPDLQAYERDGFLAIEELIGEDDVALYRAELERLVTDPAIRADERSIVEPATQEIRSVFEVHRISEVFAALVRDERVVGGPGRSSARTSTSTSRGSTSSRASGPAGSTGTRTSRPGTPRTGWRTCGPCPCRSR